MSTRSVNRKLLSELLANSKEIKDEDVLLNTKIHKNGMIEVDMMRWQRGGFVQTTIKITNISHHFPEPTTNEITEHERIYNKERQLRRNSPNIRQPRRSDETQNTQNP